MTKFSKSNPNIQVIQKSHSSVENPTDRSIGIVRTLYSGLKKRNLFPLFQRLVCPMTGLTEEQEERYIRINTRGYETFNLGKIDYIPLPSGSPLEIPKKDLPDVVNDVNILNSMLRDRNMSYDRNMPYGSTHEIEYMSKKYLLNIYMHEKFANFKKKYPTEIFVEHIAGIIAVVVFILLFFYTLYHMSVHIMIAFAAFLMAVAIGAFSMLESTNDENFEENNFGYYKKYF